MKSIGGSTLAIVQIKETKKNDLCETVSTFKNLKTIKRFLGYMSGESNLGVYNSKLEDTTHIFVCDYEELPGKSKIQLMINNKTYEVTLIDVPMGIKHHMEIYLRYVGV